jgi:hypothetical protein
MNKTGKISDELKKIDSELMIKIEQILSKTTLLVKYTSGEFKYRLTAPYMPIT